MNLNKLPSYSGLNFIMSEYMNNKQNPISSEEQYEDIDINLLLEDVVTEEQAPNTDEDYWSEKTTKEIEKYAQLNLEEDEIKSIVRELRGKTLNEIKNAFIDKTFEINFQKKVIKPELEISKPLYIDLNEIQ